MKSLQHMLVRTSAVAAVLVLVSAGFAATAESAESEANAGSQQNPRVLIDTTLGDIEVELFEKRAPRSVTNFLRLVDKGFYEGLIFHRVIAGFMVQAGGYDEGMNYQESPLDDVANESSNGLKNEPGTLAMARLADPDSANAQFYINLADNTHLDGGTNQPGYTVFGRVVEGMDVVREIELAETTRKAGMPDVPRTPIVIEGVQRL